MYKVDATGMQILLGYSDVFGEPSPNLIEEIGKMNMHKTLSIISELIGIRNVKLNPIQIFNCEISIPFETVIKGEILGIDKTINGFLPNPVFRKDYHVISLQMLLIFLKKVLIYGDYSTLSKMDYSITKEDYAQIIRLQLVITDEVEEKNKAEFDKGHFLYSTYVMKLHVFAENMKILCTPDKENKVTATPITKIVKYYAECLTFSEIPVR